MSSLDTDSEVWKYCPYTSKSGMRYQVSNMGRVRSVKTMAWRHTRAGEVVEIRAGGTRVMYWYHKRAEWDPLPNNYSYDAVSEEIVRCKELSRHKNHDGYLHTRLDKTRLVHSVVAESFIGPIPDGCEVDHMNGVRSDNRADNLRYLTRSENQLNMVRRDMYGIYNSSGRYRVCFMRNRVNVVYGRFDTLEEAKARRDEVLAELDANMREEARNTRTV
jgi:hypothetical protein